MKQYLSIGKVSKLKNVSIKSLRYYDEIGIFKPAYINEQTNYRYYKQEQLFLLDAIALCIELGIPLRSFPSYQNTDGSLNMQHLLFDAKQLAEEKIISMRNSIDTLQASLEKLQLPSPSAFPKRNIQKRGIYLLPFDEVTTSSRYNHLLLSLFVGAQRSGLAASYPSGLLYEYHKGTINRYVFVHVTLDSHSTLLENCRFLPAADYYCMQSECHHIDQAEEIFASVFETQKPNHYLVIETDILEKALTDSANHYELQLLVLDR